jgi:hypothetical protein
MFFILHILLMAISFLGITFAVTVAMFLRKKKNWLKIHKSVNSLSFGGMAAGIMMAFIYVTVSSGNHMIGLHHISGLASFVLTCMTISCGFYQFKAKNKPAVRTAHRWLGRFSVLMSLTTIVLGLKLINVI